MTNWQLRQVLKSLKQGGVIAYPSESVYGLGCDAQNLDAIAKLLDIKHRSYTKGLIVLVSQIEQAFPLINSLTIQQIKQIQQPKSRATTWLIKKSDKVSSLLAGTHSKLAVRVTSNPIAKSLCEAIQGPLVSTSCNRNGKPTTTAALVVRNKFNFKVDQVIAGSCGGQAASQIIDLESGQILRS
ncbi:MAG: threonylcarbamoyl-AMP synthase [Kangiellaceae bacterium]|nr:threonylcarbamoyl-AMP synthase [Kangiellaceae bacterium]